uniref:Aminoacyl-transfer RNA synthetases class-II family profile domain-containing protein n=1 Tax=Romanomermis culicivorax TaxID=13658 RepID=A0A915J5M0_ROMCU
MLDKIWKIPFRSLNFSSVSIYRNLPQELDLYAYRTHNCGQLKLQNVGQTVKICGWLRHKRFPKFLVVGDVYGSVQIFNDSKDQHVLNSIKHLNAESVVEIEGQVVERPAKDVNRDMVTGEIEIRLKSLKILNSCKHPLPVDVNDFVTPNQLPRMKYRYLDLRRATLQKTLRFRAQLVRKMRQFLGIFDSQNSMNSDDHQFVEVETPTLFRRTPGGAQEFIVPSSTEPGKFYSLPQSPQQFKQLLMVAGLDKYYQIARCYRDEGSKSDRQPEFTQLDIELSFTDQEKVMRLIEDVIKHSFPDHLRKIYADPKFSRMTYEKAMLNYGTDKPDLRFDWQINEAKNRNEEHSSVLYLNMPNFKDTVNPDVLENWRSKISEQFAGCVADFVCFRRIDERFEILGDSNVSLKDFAFNAIENYSTTFGVAINGKFSVKNCFFVLKTLGLLRTWAADYLENDLNCSVRRDDIKFLWVTDFPLFLPADDFSGKWESAHHPFTAPLNETLDSMRQKSPGKLIGQHYDLVLNGTELGGGSVRIHQPDLQRYVLEEILRENCQEMRHLLEAFEYGAPPHGGFAIGLDRYVSLLLKTESIRDVIAFPKVTDGRDLMTNAPSEVKDETLRRYHISIDRSSLKTKGAASVISQDFELLGEIKV